MATISTVIDELEKLKKEVGDKPVTLFDWFDLEHLNKDKTLYIDVGIRLQDKD